MLTRILTIKTIILFTTIFIFGCKKNEITYNPQPIRKVLWKIKTSNRDSTLLAYNTIGELFKVIATRPVGNPLEYTILRNPESRITQILTNTGLKHNYIYENGKLKFTENLEGNVKISENHFEYSADKLVANTLFTIYSESEEAVIYKPTFKTTYEYDAAGQLKKIISYDVDPLTNAATRTSEKVINQYDNEINPLEILSPITLVTLNEIPATHNILKETSFDRQLQLTETTVNTYTYDSNHYPVSSTSVVTRVGEPLSRINIHYYYKDKQ